MNTNSNIEELVSRYLEGDMSDIEKLNFENQLVNNPAIQEEFQLQKDVIEGIQEHRKAELKARLDNINIPSSGIAQYMGLKIAALITITTMFGFGAYFIFIDKDTPAEREIVTENRIETEIEEAPELSEEQLEISPENDAEVVTEPEESAEEIEALQKESEPLVQKESKKEDQPAAIPAPKIVKPDFVEDVAEENIDHKGDSFELNTNSLANVNKLAENKVEVETVFDRKRDFHYKFYNKKLYLYGDFEKNPYEIIEYNSNSNKLYYLYYEGKFYELMNDQMKITPLAELQDDELINELELLRK